MRQHYCGLFVQPDKKSDGAICTNDLISVSLEIPKGNYYGFFDLPIYGKHMLLDALAVIAICYYERIDAKEVAKILKTFNRKRKRRK